MKYKKIVKGNFIFRPNRFIAEVLINGKREIVHVKNTGRCKELLVEGATVYMEDFAENMRGRKLQYSIVGVEKRRTDGSVNMINMDSQAPNKVVAEALNNEKLKLPGMDKIVFIKPEAKCKDSRLDFFVKDSSGREGYIEVKGVTLEENGVALFPDAPTIRGIKHLNNLISLKQKGYMAYVIFVIQMEKTKYFAPNAKQHKDFANSLKQAKLNGVEVLAYECEVLYDQLNLLGEVAVNC